MKEEEKEKEEVKGNPKVNGKTDEAEAKITELDEKAGEPEPKTEEVPINEPEALNAVGKATELGEEEEVPFDNMPDFSALVNRQARDMEELRKKLYAPAEMVRREFEKSERAHTALTASVRDQLKVLNVTSPTVDSFNQVAERNRKLTDTFQKVVPDWEPILSSLRRGMTTLQDAQIKEYENSPYFQENLKTLSTELITLPFAPSHEALELLNAKTFDLAEFKKEMGTFDIELLRKEVANPEHENYKFKKYIEEALDNYKEMPERYRLLIPTFLLVIEGTLSETFKISDRGMAMEIKQKMNLFWDLFQASYVQRSFDKTQAFYTQVLLSNVKTVFEELTSSTNNKESFKINRNLILHGKSNPDEWLEEEFITLSQLLNTALYIKRSLRIMLDEFMELTNGNGSSIIFIEYKSNLLNVIATIKKEQKAQLTLVNTEGKLAKFLKTDLKDVFDEDETLVDEIIQKCNLGNVAKEAFETYHLVKMPRKEKKKQQK
ncbi:hypothetical protein [Planococcus donghaensis]|uniref:hypothetical protein n=1 Tax=Planococcus donghaensis TaxID=414778 RepID=UPI003736DB8C